MCNMQMDELLGSLLTFEVKRKSIEEENKNKKDIALNVEKQERNK